MVALAVIAGMWVAAWAVTWVRVLLRVIGPTNWLDTYIHTRRGMRWGLAICWPAAVACAMAGHLIEVSGTRGEYATWQILLWALLWYDALKLARMGVVSVVLLIRARFRKWHQAREWRQARSARREAERPGVEDALGGT
ncbi:hypothetical protein [Xylanimonas ulmi]|uniref:Sulfate permease n=1 Tax=Xylanimonas ulmi TaxID=228973 RepID=A0A4V2EXU9_9MICO|nr:hypothetical protein [Xylanibacterium ulmi]RZS60750.1 hypothetical protein EV386_1029 [Xylanibacterium ulmi]